MRRMWYTAVALFVFMVLFMFVGAGCVRDRETRVQLMHGGWFSQTPAMLWSPPPSKLCRLLRVDI